MPGLARSSNFNGRKRALLRALLVGVEVVTGSGGRRQERGGVRRGRNGEADLLMFTIGHSSENSAVARCGNLQVSVFLYAFFERKKWRPFAMKAQRFR